MADRNVTDTQGRIWRRYAIPDGVTLANGQSKEEIEAEIKKSVEKRKEHERNAKAKAKRKAKVDREKARKEWKERPQIIYTPMGNKR